MLAFYVDFNYRELLAEGGQAVVIVIGEMNPPALADKLAVGSCIVVYDEETRCDAILRM